MAPVCGGAAFPRERGWASTVELSRAQSSLGTATGLTYLRSSRHFVHLKEAAYNIHYYVLYTSTRILSYHIIIITCLFDGMVGARMCSPSSIIKRSGRQSCECDVSLLYIGGYCFLFIYLTIAIASIVFESIGSK